MKNSLFSLILLFSVLVSSSLRAQGVSADLPSHSPVYRHLDVLAAYGLLPSAIIGQRPYSQQEAKRLLKKAHERFDANSKEAFVEQVLAELDRELAGGPQKFPWIDELAVQTVRNGEVARAYPAGNGAGAISGAVQALSAHQQGGLQAVGGTLQLRSQHTLQAASNLAFQASPRFEWQAPEDADAHFQAYLDTAAVKLGAKNLELSFGRQEQIWGQSRLGGLAFSDQARAIDMVRLKNISPVHLPVLGEFMGTFFYGTLGPEQNYAHTQITGFKLSVKPSPLVELGGSSVTILGGKGAPDFSFTQGLREWFGFIPVVSQTAQQFSNRLMFVDARVTLPFLRYSNVYGEWMLEDRAKITRLKKMFLKDSGYLFGIFVPRLSSDGRWQARFEAKSLGPIIYKHGTFADGYTLNGKVLGDPLGPDVHSFALEFTRMLSVDKSLQLSAEYQSYDDNDYADQDHHVVRDGGREQRYLFGADLRVPLAKTVFAEPAVKYEYVESFNFQPGTNRHFAWIALNLQKTFD